MRHAARADYTAGRESHPALKTCSMTNIYPVRSKVNHSLGFFAEFLIIFIDFGHIQG